MSCSRQVIGMTDDGSLWTRDSSTAAVSTTLQGRRRRHLGSCRHCVVCGCVCWLLISNLVVNCAQGKSHSFRYLLRSTDLCKLFGMCLMRLYNPRRWSSDMHQNVKKSVGCSSAIFSKSTLSNTINQSINQSII